MTDVVDSRFTFHNVSINTPASLIVFLPKYVFTFHNVSINTPISLLLLFSGFYLHSTMFLLIPVERSR